MTASNIISWVERGYVPDQVVRSGIRQLLKSRLDEIEAGDVERGVRRRTQLIQQMNESPVALLPELANEQHYEVPAEFFNLVLGNYRKYSCGYWREGVESLDQSESDALEATCQRAMLEDGQRILELGCGWGSLTLWMASKYPNARVEAVSNSDSQRVYIENQAAERGLKNIEVVTCDMNDFDTSARYDRVVSIEMFEHMRNWSMLFSRVSGWLETDGKFFMHIFCHKTNAYEFVDQGDTDWMSRHFFSGGLMPSDDLALCFQEHLTLSDQWRWSGLHYEKTANAWLRRMDDNRAEVMPVLESVYGTDNAEIWFQRWRVFFMACAELFGFRGGREWWVSHYLFDKK